MRRILSFVCCVLVLNLVSQASAPDRDPLVSMEEDGDLTYRSYTEKGDKILDFSYSGYKRSEVPIPDVPVAVTLNPLPGETTKDGSMAYPKGPDSRARIQAALDKVAAMEPDENGFRGAVLLKEGIYYVNGELVIPSGVVLRGKGDDEDGTVLIFRNPEGVGIRVGRETKFVSIGESSRIADAYVPAGSMQLAIEDELSLKKGDFVRIRKTPNARWIKDLKMDKIEGGEPWEHDDYRPAHVREVTRVDGNRIFLDAPLPQSFSAEYGGGKVTEVDIRSESSELCGVESLAVVSNYDTTTRRSPLKKGKTLCSACRADKVYEKKKDLKVYHTGKNRQVHVEGCRRLKREKKRGFGPIIEYRFSELRGGDTMVDEKNTLDVGIRVQSVNSWVRRVTVKHTTRSSVLVTWSLYVTVRDSKSLEPSSHWRGGRRYSFSNSDSSMTLFYNNYAEEGRHDFSTGSRDTGPIAFVRGRTKGALNVSEPHQRWATGVLFDNIVMKHGGHLQAINRGGSGSGHGWAGANVVFWNCAASTVRVQDPPTSEQNFAIGWTGKQKGVRHQGVQDVPLIGNGYIESITAPVKPRSLFEQQLINRIGKRKALQVLK